MDDLSNFVLELAVRHSVDIGWRRIGPLVEAARATDDPHAFVEEAVRRLAAAESPRPLGVR